MTSGYEIISNQSDLKEVKKVSAPQAEVKINAKKERVVKGIKSKKGLREVAGKKILNLPLRMPLITILNLLQLSDK